MSARVDALEFHTTHRCHSVFSCLAPLASFHVRLVASENVATRLPPVVDRTSGSPPTFPINCTLFKLRLTLPPGEKFVARLQSIETSLPAHNQTISSQSLLFQTSSGS